MTEFETTAGVFAVLLGLIAGLLPINGWLARIVHALYAFALVLAVAVVAREVSGQAGSERVYAAARAAENVLDRHGAEIVSPQFIEDALAALRTGGAATAPALAGVEAICAAANCAEPDLATAHQVKGALETIAVHLD